MPKRTIIVTLSDELVSALEKQTEDGFSLSEIVEESLRDGLGMPPGQESFDRLYKIARDGNLSWKRRIRHGR